MARRIQPYRNPRRRTGRVILPLCFFVLLTAAVVLMLPVLLRFFPDPDEEQVLVLRDPAVTDIAYPAPSTQAQTKDDTDIKSFFTSAFSINGLLQDQTTRARTSTSLPAETAHPAAAVLPSLTNGSIEKKPGLAARIPPEYDFHSAVPENEPVGVEYLADAVLIGDSRMQGLILYTNLSQTTAYTYKGLTVEALATKEVIDIGAEKEVSVMEALSRTDFEKVYIMLGINESGWPSAAAFADAYAEVIDQIRDIHRDALIYILSIMPVTAHVSATHSYVTNEKLSSMNEKLREMAAQRQVLYVDLTPAVADENGLLPEDAGVDGIHLNKTYNTKVLDHILRHTVRLTEE